MFKEKLNMNKCVGDKKKAQYEAQFILEARSRLNMNAQVILEI